MNEEKFRRIHIKCNKNRKDLQKAKKCGCFCCLRIFSTKEIKEYIDLEGETALCPYCEVDSVIADVVSGYKVTPKLLNDLHEFFFASIKDLEEF